MDNKLAKKDFCENYVCTEPKPSTEWNYFKYETVIFGKGKPMHGPL